MSKVKCLKCGKMMDNNDSNCPHCGATYEYIDDKFHLTNDYNPSMDAVNQKKNSESTYKVTKVEEPFELPVNMVSSKAYGVSKAIYTIGSAIFWLCVCLCIIFAALGLKSLNDIQASDFVTGFFSVVYFRYAIPTLVTAFIIRCVFSWMSSVLQCLIVIANKK